MIYSILVGSQNASQTHQTDPNSDRATSPSLFITQYLAQPGASLDTKSIVSNKHVLDIQKLDCTENQ